MVPEPLVYRYITFFTSIVCCKFQVNHLRPRFYVDAFMMRTAIAQISLRIRAVWPGPLLSANRLIECLNVEQMSGWGFARVQDDVNLRILRMFECLFVVLRDPYKVQS